MRNKVLIFPSGAENALEINESIKHSVHIEVIPGSGRDDYSGLLYENEVRKLPFLNDPEFIQELNKLIEQEEIKLIFPTDDTAALILSENSEKIRAKIISADYNTNVICRYKKKTYELFKGENFCPNIYNHILSEETYPIFSKPNVGQGSQGVKLIRDIKQHELLINERDLIFVEYLPGKEYTIDCFTSKEGNLLFIGPRERAEVKMGISFKSIEQKLTKEIISIAEIINEKLKFRGLWFFQLKEDYNGNLKLLEISTRTAGTMGYFRHKGVNLPLLSVYDALDMEVEINKLDFDVTLYRTTRNNYEYSFRYKNVYIDYDDTIIINGKVNKIIMAFIYQCKNRGVKVILITKHGNNLNKSLKEYFIDPNIFDEIISLNLEESKSDFITEKDSIFIDNWFKERKEVHNKLNIPCFDVDFVGSLINK